jgi:hypothetical protein
MKAKKNVPHNSQTPQLEPILIPEAPVDPTRTRAAAGRELAPVSTVAAIPARSIKKNRKRSPERFTLQDAFDFFSYPPGRGRDDTNTEFENERCVRAVALLLHYMSGEGSEDVGGVTASGLANILQKCSGDIARAASVRERERELLLGDLEEAKKI